MGWKRKRLVLPISQIPQLLFCSLCEKILFDPVQCVRCEYHYCRSCLDNWKKYNIKCPHHCYDPLFAEAHMLMKHLLGEVELKCAYAPFGCSQYRPIQILSKHEQECQFKPVECPNQGCSMSVPKQKLKEHIQDCLGQTWACPKTCSFSTSLKSEKEAHSCHNYLDEELKQVESRFEELKQKGPREMGQTFLEVMGDNMKYIGFKDFLKVKHEFKFPALEDLLQRDKDD